MSGLKYVGRTPAVTGDDLSITPKAYVDSRYNLSLKVDSAAVTTATQAVTNGLTNQTYVDGGTNGSGGDAGRAHKAAVDAADATYIPVTAMGATNGVATIGSDGFIPSGQLPTLQLVRKPIFKNVDTIFLSGTEEVVATGAEVFRVATLTVLDPGFPYQLLPFAQIQGGSVNGIEPSIQQGTSNYAQINIVRSSDGKIYGKTITSGQKALDFFTVHPYANQNDSPTTTFPPLTGNTVLDLWIGLYGGTTYSFTSTNLVFYTMVYPVF